MKIPPRFAVALIVALVCCLGQAATARAQVFELISSFPGCTPEGCPPGGDPGLPRGPLFLASDGHFYGALAPDGRTPFEGPPRSWAIYRVDTAGNRRIVHRFTRTGPSGCFLGEMTIGGDGAVYGVAFSCDLSEGSSIFRILGTSFQVVHEFPAGGFVPASLNAGPGNTFYGIGTDSSGIVLYKWDGAIQVLGPARNGLFFNLILSAFIKAQDGNLYFPAGLYHDFYGPMGGSILRISGGGQIEPIHEFASTEAPSGVLVAGSDGHLYGITHGEGPFNSGAPPRLYRLTLSGELTYLPAPQGSRPLAAGPDGSVFFVQWLDIHGDIYRLTAAGTVVPVHTFDGTDGKGELPRLTPGPDGHLYGVRGEGGAHEMGVFYRVRLPRADLKANGGDGPITVAAGNPLEISLAFDAAPTTTLNPSEVYVALVTPTLNVFWMTPAGFTATPTRLYSGPLAAFGALPLLTIPDVVVLPAGDYYWVTIVDADANGVPNGTWVDFVKTTKGAGGP